MPSLVRRFYVGSRELSTFNYSFKVILDRRELLG